MYHLNKNVIYFLQQPRLECLWMSRSNEDEVIFLSVSLDFWELNYGLPNQNVLRSVPEDMVM